MHNGCQRKLQSAPGVSDQLDIQITVIGVADHSAVKQNLAVLLSVRLKQIDISVLRVFILGKPHLHGAQLRQGIILAVRHRKHQGPVFISNKAADPVPRLYGILCAQGCFLIGFGIKAVRGDLIHGKPFHAVRGIAHNSVPVGVYGTSAFSSDLRIILRSSRIQRIFKIVDRMKVISRIGSGIFGGKLTQRVGVLFCHRPGRCAFLRVRDAADSGSFFCLR